MESPGSAVSAASGVGNLTSGTLAAVFGEITDQAIHAREIGAVDQVPALWFDTDQAGMRQFFQMKGQRISGHAQLLGQGAGRHAGRASHDQRAEGTQPLWVSKAREGGNSLIFVHRSIIQQLLNHKISCSSRTMSYPQSQKSFTPRP